MGRVWEEFSVRHAQQRGTVPFGLATDIETFLGCDGMTSPVYPALAAEECPVPHHATNVERAAVGWKMIPFLEQHDLEASESEPIGGSRAAGP
jgi:hypothetical protein